MMDNGLEQYVVARLGKERYGFNIKAIHEIIKMEPITPIPNSKTYLLGVINLRGKVVPVISLYRRLMLPERQADKHTRIVVVNYEQDRIGVIVDSVERVAIFREIQQRLETKHANQQLYIKGIGHSEEGLVSLLDLKLLLSDE